MCETVVEIGCVCEGGVRGGGRKIIVAGREGGFTVAVAGRGRRWLWIFTNRLVSVAWKRTRKMFDIFFLFSSRVETDM